MRRELLDKNFNKKGREREEENWDIVQTLLGKIQNKEKEKRWNR